MLMNCSSITLLELVLQVEAEEDMNVGQSLEI
jgi:hypothetical protein